MTTDNTGLKMEKCKTEEMRMTKLEARIAKLKTRVAELEEMVETMKALIGESVPDVPTYTSTDSTCDESGVFDSVSIRHTSEICAKCGKSMGLHELTCTNGEVDHFVCP